MMYDIIYDKPKRVSGTFRNLLKLKSSVCSISLENFPCKLSILLYEQFSHFSDFKLNTASGNSCNLFLAKLSFSKSLKAQISGDKLIKSQSLSHNEVKFVSFSMGEERILILFQLKLRTVRDVQYSKSEGSMVRLFESRFSSCR